MRFIKSFRYILLLGTAILICFGSSIVNDYSLDDHYVTTASNDQVTQGLAGIPEIFTSPYVNTETYRFAYRPMVKATFAIEKQLFGFNPAISHVVSLLLYFILCVLVFHTLKKLLNDQPDWLIFLITLLFAIHPLHNEVVVSLKNRDEILASLAGISAFWLFLHYFSHPEKIYTLIVGFLLIGLGFISKSSIMPFVLVIPFSLFLFRKASLQKSVAVFIGLIVTGTMVQWLSQQIIGNTKRSFDVIENPLYNASMATQIINTPYLFLEYLKLHFLPYPLISYYGSEHIQLKDSTDFLPYLGLLTLIVLGLSGFLLLRKNRLLGWGLLSFLVFIGPYLNFPIPAPGIIAERYAFVSVLGFSVIFITCWHKFIFQKSRLIGAGIVILLIIMCIGVNNKRNGDWNNLETLLQKDVTTAPESIKLHTIYAEYLHSQVSTQPTDSLKIKYIRKAATHYMKAIEIYPAHAGAYENLGVLCLDAGQPENAVKNIRKAIGLGKESANTWFILGAALEISGQPQEALGAYESCLRYDSDHIEAQARIKVLNSSI